MANSEEYISIHDVSTSEAAFRVNKEPTAGNDSTLAFQPLGPAPFRNSSVFSVPSFGTTSVTPVTPSFRPGSPSKSTLYSFCTAVELQVWSGASAFKPIGDNTFTFSATSAFARNVFAPSTKPLPRSHVVSKGETLSKLSLIYGISCDEIVSANGLKNQTIVLGQKLCIPTLPEVEPSVSVSSSEVEVLLPPAEPLVLSVSGGVGLQSSIGVRAAIGVQSSTHEEVLAMPMPSSSSTPSSPAFSSPPVLPVVAAEATSILVPCSSGCNHSDEDSNQIGLAFDDLLLTMKTEIAGSAIPLPESQRVSNGHGHSSAAVVREDSRSRSPSPTRQRETTYVVKKGDTLRKIATMFDTTVEALSTMNGIGNADLKINQRLRVVQGVDRSPSPPSVVLSPSFPSFVPTVPLIVSHEFIAAVPDPKIEERKPARLFVAAPNTATSYGAHVVDHGETLVKIASQHNVSVGALMHHNGLDSGALHHRQILIIPPYGVARGEVARMPKDASKLVRDPNEPVEHVPYQVRKGDTLQKIAFMSGTTVTELMQLNETIGQNGVAPEQTLVVPLTTRYQRGRHFVRPGESLDLIATQYGVTVASLKQTNNMKFSVIYIGDTLTIPAPAKPAFGKPVESGWISSIFGWRWGRMHEGVDLAAEVGTPIYAAQGGVVRFAGWCGSFGYLVDLQHPHGYLSKYAHVRSIHVREGQRVEKGDMIATVGSTGRSTGPHLHFEVRKYGRPLNPLDYVDVFK